MSGVKSKIPRVQTKGPGGRLGNLNPLFQKQTADLEALQISPLVVKQARKSGKLSLSGKNLTTVPERVWHLENLDEAEVKMIDMRIDDSVRPDGDAKWWEHEPLTNLDVSNNCLNTLSPKIKLLSSLTNLMLHNNCLTILPKEIGQLKQLTKLNISHNKLESLPEELFKLTELTQLNFSFNLIRDISESIGYLIMLEKLDMSHNRLTVLPPDVGFLTRLTQLSALHNAITDVPPDVGNLRVLRELDLSHNSIPTLPPMGELKKLEIFRAEHNNISDFPDIRGCMMLRELHLSGNCISEIPEDMLEEMSSIKVMALRDNKLESIPEEMTLLKSLIRLDIGNNGIKDLPASLSMLPHLSTLSIDGNPLKTVRSDIIQAGTTRVLKVLRGQMNDEGRQSMSPGSNGLPGVKEKPWPNKYNMKSNRSMNLAMRELTEVPEDIFNEAVSAEVSDVDICKNMLTTFPSGIILLAEFLTELNLSSNKLTSLPESLVSCKRLHYLEVSQNYLSDLPASFDGLEQLREINISYNRFDCVPSCLYGMPGLEILLARDNKIKVIDSAGLGSIPRLATLDLANNDINFVPPHLGLLRLYCLELTGNPFRIPRHNILEKGTPSILSYLRDRLPK